MHTCELINVHGCHCASLQFTVRNTGWVGGGSGKKVLFTHDAAHSDEPILSTSGAVLTVRISTGLPVNSSEQLEASIASAVEMKYKLIY